MRTLLIGLMRLYRSVFSALLGYGKCRFTPTCSQYGIEAVEIHGSFKGLALTIWRILRCQPLCRGGFDPVPPAPKKNDS